MVANWWNPVELIVPTFWLVVTVWVGFFLWIFFSKILYIRDQRNRHLHVAWMRETQGRMNGDEDVSATPTSASSYADIARTVVLLDDGGAVRVESYADVPAMRAAESVNLDVLPEQRAALALESREDGSRG